MPGQTCARSRSPSCCSCSFNGGPGNCPAKLVVEPVGEQVLGPPSMEGRAIARPNPSTPAERITHADLPSMEGRAIARPNLRRHRGHQPAARAFNGGPGNCPAKLAWVPYECKPVHFLQWRAGQLPGQTASDAPERGWQHEPSMEGRAIARPNSVMSRGSTVSSVNLQWRAGQLPGQTSGLFWRCGMRSAPFNGGPGNCPAKQWPGRAWRNVAWPSMEGRAIARPNVVVVVVVVWPGAALQWRAGQLPGQTLMPTGVSIGRSGAFNGGPGNCPAKPERHQLERRRSVCLQWRAGQLPGQTCATTMLPQGPSSTLQWRAGQLPGQTRSFSW